ncbi:hypothetical protein CTAM01_13562 [Colletotrichum tamarilloi]|uniref:Chitin-binding type-4 domain-containing protein n=1 Tax=Colletotrichum tamarilloi TaxID=1209934 RepID=A0ABQ9QRM5_9PEZI|nr:uncharacterized protein CTAM01_13562 [Colletotrichum tamarilloi]KAK1482402.1 hypothetical protein CTAM01_13562 [Colletotrichum tamarilloi]
MRASITAATALLAALVSAHGNIVSSRLLPVVSAPQWLQRQLDLCRGAKFEDNKANVQTFKAGQVVNMKAEIPIPHEGPMNVSIVDTATNKVIGQPLIVFDSYADENLAALPKNNTDFDITMPSNLPAGTCAQAGQCVVQWFWVGTAAKQTYESCVDFVMA